MDGVDYEQLAHLMKYFGAVDAVNLDGGGSTTMLFMMKKMIIMRHKIAHQIIPVFKAYW